MSIAGRISHRGSIANHRLFGSNAQFAQRNYSDQCRQYPQGLFFWPNYFSKAEQRTLLAASLHKLDTLETRRSRIRRKEFWNSRPNASAKDDLDVASLFAPDDMYEFQEGHFDGVIQHFREMHVSTWPVEQFQNLRGILDRLYFLCPTKDNQTHILHLSSGGEILPHIDNVNASGSWILGVSLGNERILRMKKLLDNEEEFALNLPSGSVYLQRDQVRYGYLHSIGKISRGDALLGTGQRLSIMIRDRNTNSEPLL